MAHIFLQIRVLDSCFDPDQIPEHSRHHILSKDDNFLMEEFDATWIGTEMDLGDFGTQTRGEGRGNRWSGKCGRSPGVQRPGNQEEMRFCENGRKGCQQLCEGIKVVCKRSNLVH